MRGAGFPHFSKVEIIGLIQMLEPTAITNSFDDQINQATDTYEPGW